MIENFTVVDGVSALSRYYNLLPEKASRIRNVNTRQIGHLADILRNRRYAYKRNPVLASFTDENEKQLMSYIIPKQLIEGRFRIYLISSSSEERPLGNVELIQNGGEILLVDPKRINMPQNQRSSVQRKLLNDLWKRKRERLMEGVRLS